MSSSGRPAGGAPRTSTASGGRTSAAVYRRRRIAVGIVALVLLVGIVLGATALARAVAGGGEPAPAATTTTPAPTVTPTAAPTPGETPTPGPTNDVAALPDEAPVPATAYSAGYMPEGCRRGSVEVTSETSSTVYGVGGIVSFTVTLRNTGDVPCLVEGGSAALGVVVSSGSDRVWSSTDCPSGATARPLLLDVDAEEVVRIPWDQTRSQPGCAESGTAVGAGTYRGTVTLDAGTTTDSRTQVQFVVKEG